MIVKSYYSVKCVIFACISSKFGAEARFDGWQRDGKKSAQIMQIKQNKTRDWVKKTNWNMARNGIIAKQSNCEPERAKERERELKTKSKCVKTQLQNANKENGLQLNNYASIAKCPPQKKKWAVGERENLIDCVWNGVDYRRNVNKKPTNANKVKF